LAWFEPESGNFSAQVKFLNLDPKSDFQHADLSGVDLSTTLMPPGHGAGKKAGA
jgi:hypothetical protein